ncbi:serine/threonine-protein kinase PLK1-like isoform X1 [Dermatophagoides pteronyssinus]|uniref:serine/threonine-protein kinase PLK1-like isoform X1 n=2 Tax=Dermatophagoides pteronyssinus TaxID=6956 RepID=UPI003F6781DC
MDKYVGVKKYIKTNNSNYLISDYLGKGSYAIVVRAINVNNNQTVAIKMLLFDNKNDEERNKRIELLARKEAEILFQLRSHRNIVEIFDYFQTTTNDDDNHHHSCFLILELCANKSLNNLLRNEQINLTKEMIKTFLFDIITGCHYLHSKLIVHRDLKPDNILMNENYVAKIGDFGLATQLESSDKYLYTFCGTPKYQAPEMILKNGYNFPVDIWAIGCIAYRLYYGNAPFNGTNSDEIYRSVLNKNIKCCRISCYDFMVNNEDIKVIRSMLIKEPEKRIKIDDLLAKKRFFADKLSSLTISATTISSSSSPTAQNNNQQKNNPRKRVHLDSMIDYLKAIANYESNKLIRINYIPYHDNQLTPIIMIRQWIEIAMIGFGYDLGHKTYAFNFRDQTKMMMLHNEFIFYMDNKNATTQSSICEFQLKCCPDLLKKKLKILQQSFNILHRTNIVDDQTKIVHDDDGDDDDNSIIQLSRQQQQLPWLQKWIKTIDVFVFQLANKLIQINFSQQKKILLFDSDKKSMTIINQNTQKKLSLALSFILNGNVTDRMRQYVSVALQYIELINK